MTTLQSCYESILSNKIDSVFNFPGIKQKALNIMNGSNKILDSFSNNIVDGVSNTIIAKRLDELSDTDVFSNLLIKVSLAHSVINQSGSLTLAGEFNSFDISDVQCLAMKSLLSV